MKFLLRNIYLLFIFICYNSNASVTVDGNMASGWDFIYITNDAQILEPVTWEFDTVKLTDTEYELVFTANIDPKWSVYSQEIDGFGPIPTSFEFSENLNIEFIDGVIEDYTNRVTEQDPVFDMVVSKFYTKAKFIQKVKLKDKTSPVSGYLTFMTCDDTRCLPPTDIDFIFELGSSTTPTNDDKNSNSSLELLEDSNILLYGYKPEEVIAYKNKSESEVSASTTIKSKTLFSIFGLGFIGGLLALLTPCVFPMIPLTVSFFTKQNDKKGVYRALLYGIFIVLVYLLLSVPFHLLDSVNPDILNEISTNVTLNIIFFLIFIFFAFSFFGYYELTLPSSWVNNSTKGETFGGVLGVFFMALTLAVVSFSCTGPILGSLLASSITSDGGAWQLTAGMGGFGVALGLPFALFAMFPKVLSNLPKSGSWLNTIKVVLGFVELALALKFLSNADLVAHWNLLKIEVFLFLWFVISACLTLYLLGVIKFPHDQKVGKFSFIRICSIVLAFSFSIYLASGFTYNSETSTFKPLSLLSGLAPPVGYSILYPNDCPNNLDCFKDLKSGIEYAKKVNKPILLDFTGFACVNCRKMEEHIWPLSSIDKIIRNEYVLISLYVDDKKLLPKEEQVLVKRSTGDGFRKLKNFGHKWAHFQTEFFQTNSQPYYVLLNPEGNEILASPVGYTPSEEDYLSFLRSGLESFDSKSVKFNIN
jgi:thiol:disulfide interchange protein DsbD